MKYRFYKEEDNRWYVDLPDYIINGGEKSELEMLAGADEMLDILSYNGDVIILNITKQEKECRCKLELLKAYDGLEGSDYIANICVDKINAKIKIWLCAVMLYIYDEYPENLYIS